LSNSLKGNSCARAEEVEQARSWGLVEAIRSIAGAEHRQQAESEKGTIV